MKLSREDFELLRAKDKSAFLVKAYLSYDPTPSIRECAEATGLKKTTCHRLMRCLGFVNGTQNGTASGTQDGTRKPTRIKAKKVVFGTANGTANGTKVETPKARRIKVKKVVAETLSETPNETASETLNETTTPLRQIFDDYYRGVTDLEFYWTPKEATALKYLERKISKGMQDKGVLVSREGIADNFKTLLGIIDDPWILDNLSPSIINSKYNDIRTRYKSRQGHSQRGRGASQGLLDEFQNAIKENFGIGDPHR